MAFDAPPREILPDSVENPKYVALNLRLNKKCGYGFQTFYGRMIALEAKIADEKRELTLVGLPEADRLKSESRLTQAKELLGKLLEIFKDEETRRLWEDYAKIRPDLDLRLDKKTGS